MHAAVFFLLHLRSLKNYISYFRMTGLLSLIIINSLGFCSFGNMLICCRGRVGLVNTVLLFVCFIYLEKERHIEKETLHLPVHFPKVHGSLSGSGGREAGA